MKTAIRQTSVDAYYGIEKLNDQQSEVLTAIKVLGESCIADIAAYLNWERSTVSGRLNELKKMDRLSYVGKKKSSRTGITSEFWRAKEFKEFKETLF